MKLSFRTSQLLFYTLVVALMGSFTIYTGVKFITETVVKEAKTRVQMDINSAWAAYDEQKMLVQMAVCQASHLDKIKDALITENCFDDLKKQLDSLKDEHNLDFLTLIDINKNALTNNHLNTDEINHARDDPIINRALSGKANNGTILVSREFLMHEQEELAQRAYTPLIQTEYEKPTDKEVEDRGMVLKAAIPITGSGGKILGAIAGGILLNRNHTIVDNIRRNVFSDQIYEGKPLGTVTIFLWDVRITTNVIKVDSTRAIGTRVSEQVFNKVLEQGERFGDRAFVVNDWYLSAYDPIFDPDGEIIGIFYVGLLEKKYLDYKSSLAMEFIAISLLSLLLAFVVAFFISIKLRQPVLGLVEATRKISDGNLGTRVRTSGVIKELTELGNAFNNMAEALEKHQNQLNEASLALKKALAEADDRNSAYLEMLGFVTHELKSPLASIVFAIESLRERILGPISDKQDSILKAASNSAQYLNFTIANYLNLSRIEEGALELKPKKVNFRKDIIDPVVQRLYEMVIDNKMIVTCNIPEETEATCDRDLLTSVFQNLLSNAIKYGKEGGKITIDIETQTRDDLLKFNVYNEGLGFTEEEGKKLFTKFSRFGMENQETKPGTGLGLFVTRKIIQKHGGDIIAESEPGQWANFIFTISTKIKTRENQI